jgi:cytochrome c-type biogenesis protein CcmH
MTALVLTLLLVTAPAWAGAEAPMAADQPADERFKRLTAELRCLVCQNQTLADSHAPLAEDLRREIREMLAQHMTDREITDFLVQRYGDFVLYRPPWKATTLVLWIGPFVLLGFGTVAFVLALRRRARRLREVPLTEEEQRRVERWLSHGGRS